MNDTDADIDIIACAFRMAHAVVEFFQRAREFYYRVMLAGHACPKCDGPLVMIGEGRCRCLPCGHRFDPTIAFQRCSACGGALRLQICRYRCSDCGIDVTSKFLFETRIFDARYFKAKMAQSRNRKDELREQVRKMLAQSRSPPLLPGAGDLEEIPGLVEVLNGLTVEMDLPIYDPPKGDFDLARYQSHIQAHVKPYWVEFDQIPPVSENRRLDRVWRFIAMIFLAQDRVVELRQNGDNIRVKQYEIDEQGSGIFNEDAGLNGIEGSMG